MPLGLEKRSGSSVPVNCPLQIMLKDGREFLGLAHDLKVDGILFYCPVQLATAEEAAITYCRPKVCSSPR